jgi:hypothetical protein
LNCTHVVVFYYSPKEPPPPPPAEQPWEEVESDVVHLNDGNFKNKLKKKKHTLVMFYAPCKLKDLIPVVVFSQFANFYKKF